MRLLIRIIINMFGLWLAAYIVPRISLADDSLITLLLLAVVFGLINAFIRPIARILDIPHHHSHVGAVRLCRERTYADAHSMADRRPDDIEGSFFESLVAALFGSLIISIVSTVAEWLLPDKR